MGTLAFPGGFLWGAATSAYQVEGAVDADGRGASIWDVFSHTSGAIRGGDTGDVACDHYRRYGDDVALMAELGLGAYRFSVAWPRVQPEGRGSANAQGLDFYSRLVDALLAAGITPLVTLYHWDLPEALQQRGGWTNRDTAGRFGDYAEQVAAALGDRVRLWTTLNEPWCAAFLGHASGEHAPGVTDPDHAIAAAHHLLLAHGYGVQATRAGAAADVAVGVVLNLAPVSPQDDSESDRDAARLIDGLQNRLFCDPILKGAYPDDIVAHWAERFDTSALRREDLATIAEPIDLLGVNYYFRHVVRAGSERAGPTRWPGASHVVFPPPAGQVTAMGWGVDPGGLTETLVRLSRDYPPLPLYVTENGAAFDDEVDPDGTLDDADRVGYLDAHLRALADAVERDVDVRGYFVWSLLDNFEWEQGFAKRFGIVHVDYATLARTPKRSAWWYRDVIARGGATG